MPDGPPPALSDLEITDLGIIRHVALALGPGLNVLTGETGAGKTMVVSGLQWLLGGRAERDKVRSGARSAVVQGRFEPPPPTAADWTDPDDPDLIVTREIGARADEEGGGGGRSRARIGGRMAPVTALAELLDGVVEIHSQHESLRLADPAVQRSLLDRFGGAPVDAALGPYQAAHRAWRDATARLDAAERSAREDLREADRLRAEVEEIAATDPSAGEEDTLDEEIGRLEHAESLAGAAATATAALTDDGGARDAVGAAVSALRDVVRHDPALAEPLARLEAAMAEVQDTAFELAAYAEGLDADPAALDAALGRRAAIGRLLRKYGPTTSDVRAYRDQAADRLAACDGGEERLAALRAAADEAAAELGRCGDALREARRAAAVRLAETVDGHLAELAMPDARTTVEVEPGPPGPDGADRVEVLLSANRGQPALPLGRAASGGERSRVALAVKVALADADETPVMVFDEVDAGIGGETALAVGRKLARLARGRQVLCVTHLAQLAAFADAHFVVSKAAAGETTTTTVQRLDDAGRVAELSRMLSGSEGGEAALSHARELLRAATPA